MNIPLGPLDLLLSTTISYGSSRALLVWFDVEVSLSWVVAAATIVAFALAWAIGANDVANTFGTSVGAKVLKVWQAVIIASIFEFLGAFLMGAQVADTIQGLIYSDYYESNPAQLAVGMTCAMFGAWFLITLATYFNLPVSGTHAVVGAVIGFGLVSQGWDGVVWKEIGLIVASWFVSPVAAGLLALFMFLAIRTFILRSQNAFMRTLYFMPFAYFFTLTINVFFVVYKGSGGGIIDFSSLELWAIFTISIGSGIVAAVICLAFLPYARKRALQREAAKQALEEKITDEAVEEEVSISISKEKSSYGTTSSSNETLAVSSGLSLVDDPPYKPELEESGETEESVAQKSEEIEKEKDFKVEIEGKKVEEYDPKAEQLFSLLQVLTACFGSFAHGANDVANAIGPYATVIAVFQTGEVVTSADVTWYILLFGGAGIIIGLSTWGYRVMKTIGEKLVKVTPSRGFNIELGSAITVLVGSKLGLPLSSTHCKVGAVVGVGLADGRAAVNWKLVLIVFFSWFVTVPVSAVVCILIYLLVWNMFEYYVIPQ